MPSDQFQVELQQRVRLASELDEQETTLSESFTKLTLEMLTEAAEASNPMLGEAQFESKRMSIAALDYDEDRTTLTVVVSRYSAEQAPDTIIKTELVRIFKSAERFLEASIAGLYRDLEESSSVFDIARYIFDKMPAVTDVRYLLLTNAALRTAVPPAGVSKGWNFKFEVWDIERLRRLASSGRSQEPIDIAVSEYETPALEYVGPFGQGAGYDAYLVVVPALFLAAIYEEHGPRLLELNVRSFLQTRNKTNQGMQNTLRNSPENFLAFNNGLSMTASSVETEIDAEGRSVISRLKDLQIVNGGQTTASIYHASRRSAVDVSVAMVQAKLTVLNEEVRGEIAPLISRFANTQNPIRMADFSANDPFHIQLEKLSRSVWAPAPDGSHEMTRWFYERSRGQYADALARERTPAQKRKFSETHPRRQMFAKTDVAKFSNSWMQLPHVVSLGAEKNFNEFSQRHAETKSIVLPDQVFFQELVAKAILWRSTESQVARMRLGGYRSAVVAYVVALISNRTSMRLDLAATWKAQKTSGEWDAAVEELAPLVHADLIRSAGTRNVLEWAKKKECWASIQEIAWTPPENLVSANRADRSRVAVAASQGTSSLPASDEELAGRKIVEQIGADAWFDLANWAKETNNLMPWQRGLAASVGSYLGRGRQLSSKQITQAVIIATEAHRLGFELKLSDRG